MPRLAGFKNVLLLGYLALFLNLGPSLHRAPIFGLHSHANRGDATLSCDCGQHHGSSEDSGHGDVKKSPCDDCALCRFFNHYNVIIDLDDEFLFVDRSIVYPDLRTPQFCLATILQTARGPPAA